MLRFCSQLILAAIIIFGISCTKIDTTKLGGNLVPEVDNVHTFDTILNVVSNNYIFDDSTRLSRSDAMAIGEITNDPLFGNTKASLYVEMKPLFPFKFFSKDSLVAYDSTVLSLKLKGTFGDTLQNIQFSVYALSENLRADTSYTIESKFSHGALLGQKTITASSIRKDTIRIYRSNTLKDSVVGTLRIRLDNIPNYWKSLMEDSIALSNDTLFKLSNQGMGLYIEAKSLGSPGCITYYDLSDVSTGLQFYYRRNPSNIDTTSAVFPFNINCGFANNVQRDRSGAEINNHLATDQSDSLLYIYTSPGSYAKIKIPGLENLSNRIVHRAELKIYQVLGNPLYDSKLTAPPYLYLDRIDTGAGTFLPITIDLNPSLIYDSKCFPTISSGYAIDYSYFGGYAKSEVINGQAISTYDFNISRYIQSIITKKELNRTLRLSATLNSPYQSCPLTGNIPVRVTPNRVAEGRIKIGGGAKPNSTWPYKMQLRIIYSKI